MLNITLERIPFSKGRLPLRPSELLRLAAKDIRAVMANPKMDIDMGFWSYPRRAVDDGYPKSVCTVCLAGAVMVGTLGALALATVTPHDFGRDRLPLSALDRARSGDWSAFINLLREARGLAQMPPLRCPDGGWSILSTRSKAYAGWLSGEQQEQLVADLETWAVLWEGDEE